jgi:hypothetical protein
MPDKILGMGGYGCILTPAIVFHDSKEVTEYNMHEYVTKISANAEEEYNNCELAKSIIGPSADIYGIFPVDRLHCGVSIRDLGDVANNVIQKCFQIEDRAIVGKYKTAKRDYTKPKNDFYISAGEIDPRSYLCAIQYPLYDYDLKDFKSRVKEALKMDATNELTIKNVKDVMNAMELSLAKGLKLFHSKGIIHLDIKDGNVGISKGDAKFADWDFVCFEQYKESVDDCYEKTLLPNFREYYEKGLTLRQFNVSDMFDYVESNTLNTEERVLFLKSIDWACLFSTLLHIWRLLGQEIYEMKLNGYLQLFTSEFRHH